MNQEQLSIFSPGPLHAKRKNICVYLKSLPLKTGDILCRLDNYVIYGVPFSKLVAHATNSPYDHAAVVYIENNEIYVLEVSDMGGTCKFSLIDWLDFSAVNYFTVYRLKEDTVYNISKLDSVIKAFFEDDPDYDFNFEENRIDAYYCNRAVAVIYERAGFLIGNPMLIKDVIHTKWGIIAFKIINAIIKWLTGYGFDLSQKVYFIGNEHIGMASSPLLKKVLDFKSQNVP